MENASSGMRAAPTPRRFSTLLVSLVLALALPLMALSVVLAVLSAFNQREKVLDGLQATARGLQLVVDRELGVTVAALQTFASSPAIDAALASRTGPQLEAFRAQANDLLAHRLGAVHNVTLYAAPDGERVADALAGNETAAPVRSMEEPEARLGFDAAFDPNALVDTVARTRRPYVSDLFHDPDAERFLVSVGAPVLRDGRLLGVLAADLRPESLGELLRASATSDADRAALVDRAGVIVARSNDAESFVGQLAVEDVRRFQTTSESLATIFQTETVDGQLVYGALRRLSEAPWTVVYGAPRRLVDGPVRRELFMSGAASVLALAVFLLTASWQGRRLGREIATLGSDAVAIGLGKALPAREERVHEVADVRAALRAGVAALSASEERMRLATESVEMATFDLDLGTGEMVLSNHGYRMLGLDPDQKATRDLWLSRVHPADLPEVEQELKRSEAEDRVLHAIYRIRKADTGAERWIENFARHLPGASGARRLTGVGFDVTDRRVSEERQTLLIREVDHRAKNVLAVVQAILRLTRADDAEAFATAVEGRVQALARAHELLARDRWQGAGLRPLAAQELAAPLHAGRAALQGPDLQLRPDAVQPLAMVLHELLTNALRHGALSVDGGHVLLAWDLDPGEDGALRLRWLERGGPQLAGPPATKGFGFRMVDATVKGQLGGTIDRRWNPGGLDCEIAVARRFVAPAATEQEDLRPPAAAAAKPEAGLEGARVLLAEDEALIAADLSAMLVQAGCEVIGPGVTLAEAQALARSAERIDAAVLDLNLLGESSVPLAEALLARGVPVVAVTGYDALPADWERRAELASFLRKPVEPGELHAALAKATLRKI